MGTNREYISVSSFTSKNLVQARYVHLIIGAEYFEENPTLPGRRYSSQPVELFDPPGPPRELELHAGHWRLLTRLPTSTERAQARPAVRESEWAEFAEAFA